MLAPTGTIGFMMDCDTTGIEPDLALVKYKKLVGGGMIKIVNNTVPEALFKLGYDDEEVNAIVSYIDATGTIEGAPGIQPEHLAVFDCSFKPAKGTRSIHYMGHIKMMAAAQPFLSGAISKTVNLPHEASVEEIAEAYAESWRQGIKAVAIYRDGSKGTQPLNTSMDAKKEPSALDAVGSRVLAQLAAGQPAAEADLKVLEAKGGEKLEVTARQMSLPRRGLPARWRRSPRLPPCPCLQPAGTWTPSTPKTAQDLNAPPRAVRHRLPGRARLHHPQVLHRRPRGLHHRRPLSHRAAGRNLHQDGQGGLHRLRPDGRLRHLHLARPAAWRAAQGAVREVRPHPLRALRLDRQRADRLRQEPHGLHLPLARSALPLRHAVDALSGLAPQAPQLPASPSMLPETEPEEDAPTRRSHLARLAEEVAKRLNQVSGQPATGCSGGGIAPRGAGSCLSSRRQASRTAPHLHDRGIYHATEAMREMYEMGDAPSCPTCGAIMVRNGSCYRCMSCGSTSGCS